jgi:hypothetical protein
VHMHAWGKGEGWLPVTNRAIEALCPVCCTPMSSRFKMLSSSSMAISLGHEQPQHMPLLYSFMPSSWCARLDVKIAPSSM